MYTFKQLRAGLVLAFVLLVLAVLAVVIPTASMAYLAKSIHADVAVGTATYAVSFAGGMQTTDDIEVYVNGTENTAASVVWLSGSTLQLVGYSPAAGDDIEFRRVSPKTDNLVDLEAGKTIRASSLMKNFRHVLQVGQEAYDASTTVITLADESAAAAIAAAEDAAESAALIDPENHLYVVPNMFSLGSVTADNYTTVYLAGHTTQNDGGQGIWKWNSTSIAGEDNGTVRAVIGVSTGRWLRSDVQGDIDSKWFGTGSAAVQAAVDAFPGRTILIYSDTYTSTIDVDTTGLGDTNTCRFVGQGMYKTIINNQTGGPAFHVTSGNAAEFAYGFEASDFTITCSTPSSGTSGIRLDGCRFAEIKRVFIDDMASHGIHGISSIGDYTDTSQIKIEQTQIQDCGGYGIYAESSGGAIQYNWNIDQCRIGLNDLGGVLLESMTNSVISNTGIYYNEGFGIKVTNQVGGPAPKIIEINHCEFDTNDGIQLDIETGVSIIVNSPYLVANAGVSGKTFTKGIVVRSGVTGTRINNSYPRLNPALTGLTVHEFVAGSIDTVVRDTSYNGYIVGNGDMYLDNEPTTVIDDRAMRNQYETGTYTAYIKDSTLAKTSATTLTAFYTKNGNLVTVTFRNFNNISLTPFASGDIICVTLPFSAKTTATFGSAGNCVITSDAGSGTPYPIVDAGGSVCAFIRSGTGAYLTTANLTDGVSDIRSLTISYMVP